MYDDHQSQEAPFLDIVRIIRVSVLFTDGACLCRIFGLASANHSFFFPFLSPSLSSTYDSLYIGKMGCQEFFFMRFDLDSFGFYFQ